MKNKKYYEEDDKLWLSKRLALAILQEIKNGNSPVKVTDCLGKPIDIDKAIATVRRSLERDYKKRYLRRK